MPTRAWVTSAFSTLRRAGGVGAWPAEENQRRRWWAAAAPMARRMMANRPTNCGMAVRTDRSGSGAERGWETQCGPNRPPEIAPDLRPAEIGPRVGSFRLGVAF